MTVSAHYMAYPVHQVAACAHLHALQQPATQAFALAAHLLQRFMFCSTQRQPEQTRRLKQRAGGPLPSGRAWGCGL